MNKKSVKVTMVVAMLFAISLYFVGGTYARYVTEFEGTASVDVATWAVKLTDGGTDKALALELTPSTSDDVVEGKIAPGISAEGTAKISLAGTEVAVEVQAEVDKDAVKTALTEAGLESVQDHDITVTTTVAKDDGSSITVEGGQGGQPYTIALPDGGFKETDIIKVTVTVTWDNADDAHNPDHTTIGEKGGVTLSIPVKLHVYQHITGEDYTLPTE